MTWRVRDRATFDVLAATPRRRRGPVSLSTATGIDAAPPRVAYSVSKRVGGAVTRNRVRRRLRASVARHRSRLQPGAAYLFVATPGAASSSFGELDTAVEALLGGPRDGTASPEGQR